ncbi:MAG TPA: hypothetical protein VGN11_02260 [Candidatus Baltobacteraceae bacterium]|jgi:hypothetical protein|nr:hypothetical protein [Candidatus Baltobacteraceae bacterium]
MTQSVHDFENTFARARQLLAENWVIVVPGLVLGAIGGALEFLVSAAVLGPLVVTGDGTENMAVVTQTIVTVSLTIVSVLIAIVQMAYVTSMAGAAWKTGHTTLVDGWNAFSHRGLHILVAVVLLFVLGICAAVFAPITFLLTLLAYMVFFIYTMASVIIGGRKPIAAIAESCRLSLANFVPTLGIVVLIAAIALAGAWIGTLVGRLTPFGGGLIAGVLQQVIVAYASLVVVGEYLKLSQAGGPATPQS